MYLKASPRKTPVVVYSCFRSANENHGLFHRVLCDKGTENHLVCFVQDQVLAPYVPDTSPHSKVVDRVKSVQNVRIERLWGEINRRVSESVRWSLDHLRAAGVIDLDNPVHVYCVSTITVQVVQAMIDRFVLAHNNHHVRHVGIPNSIHRDSNRATTLPVGALPTTTAARERYEAVSGAPLNVDADAGEDPLLGDAAACAERDAFLSRFDIDSVVRDLHSTLSGRLVSDPVPSRLFCALVEGMIVTTERLAMEMH